MTRLAGVLLGVCGAVAAAGVAHAEPMTAAQILSKVDEVLYAPKDKKMEATFVLVDKGGDERRRTVEVIERGTDCRLMRFTAPADQKGIAFLSLPDDIMYLYLPAFGRERRIASHVKSTGFAGTDLSYEDLEPKRYSERWEPKLTKTDDTHYYLELTPKPDTETDYSKLLVTVRKDNFYPMHVRYFDSGGEPCKEFVRHKVEKRGRYWEAIESEMTDLRKEHSTKLILNKIEFDSGVSDDVFSVRYLKR